MFDFPSGTCYSNPKNESLQNTVFPREEFELISIKQSALFVQD